MIIMVFLKKRNDGIFTESHGKNSGLKILKKKIIGSAIWPFACKAENQHIWQTEEHTGLWELQTPF